MKSVMITNYNNHNDFPIFPLNHHKLSNFFWFNTILQYIISFPCWSEKKKNVSDWKAIAIINIVIIIQS